MAKDKVQSFRRIFKYIWPQWPRLVIIFVTVVIIGVLFAGSFATVIPLLKVMMGEEGFHGWIDRRSCDWRYGMDFYVVDRSDVIDGENSEMLSYLLVTGVDEEGQAFKAGIKPQDKVVAVGQWDGIATTSSSKLFEELATVDDGAIMDVHIKRADKKGLDISKIVKLKSLPAPDDMDKDEYGFTRRLQWGFEYAAMTKAQWAASLMPRGNDSNNKQKAVMFIILMMAAVTTARCIATFYQKYMAEKVVQVATAGLREDVFAHIMVMPVGYFSTRGTSDTISRLVGDTSGLGKGVKILLGKTPRETFKAICCLAFAFMLSWKLTLIFLGAAPVVVGLLGMLGGKIKKATRRSLVSSARILGKVQDTLKALRVVKVYNRQEHESEAFLGLNRKFLRQTLRVAKVQAATGPIMEFLGMVAGTSALIVGSYWVCSVSMTNQMESSHFFGLLLFLGTAAESVRKVSDVWNKIQEANAAAERVYEIIDMKPEAEDASATELGQLHDKIEFRNITFTYPGSENTALKGVNLTVNAGETVAVVGPNGSGKTTLINLLPRFYDPDNGQIFIDGNDIRKGTLSSLRAQIAMVTQNVVTFNDTIASNIAYGRPSASEKEIIDAAKCSYANEFIAPIPEGYDTLIGEHGSGFSGGQLQRMVIARAVLKNPAILIFDEAMSQVDADSEAKIHKALDELMTGRTCFVIAHRFSTVISADRIVVMDDGEIVAQGTHEELIKSCSLYQNLYETQLMAPESE